MLCFDSSGCDVVAIVVVFSVVVVETNGWHGQKGKAGGCGEASPGNDLGASI